MKYLVKIVLIGFFSFTASFAATPGCFKKLDHAFTLESSFTFNELEYMIMNREPGTYGMGPFAKEIIDGMEKLVRNTNSPDDLLGLLDSLNDLAFKKRNYIANEREMIDLASQHIYKLIVETSLLNRIYALRPSFTVSQSEAFVQGFNLLEKNVYQMLEDNRGNIHSRLKSIRMQVEVIFDETKAAQFLDYILNEYSTYTPSTITPVLAEIYISQVFTNLNHSMQYFSPFSVRLLANLSTDMRAKLNKTLGEEYIKVLKLSEKADADDKAELKKKRRNLEFLKRVLNNDVFQEQFSKIESGLYTQAIGKRINTYFKNANFDFKYDFNKVLEIANDLKSSSITELMEEGDYFILYGSFPNGKMNLKKSDIDLHPSKGLLKRENDTFELWTIFDRDPELETYSNKLKFDEIAKRAIERTSILEQVENDIAKTMRTEIERKGSFLSIIANDSDFFDIEKLGVYNPVIIKIYKDQVIVNIVDGLNGLLVELKVP
ncbi:hypothetical protein M899_2931 [Bacteriovorax sp. BSW11_IV]|uniref:hypothetical protein n=1 Tax=Bacteriovorax sp. BSW11_IV TaxID=1353529 RepID=UPI00038A4018|nr:hypothetical protein [Bacteriovorax sp. BSW11_IV]EQC50184.1 hypothetical protein M899_2931 [Bacteriovorax sp. BSW11_IV]